MAFIPNKLESAFIQRDSTNTVYEQINVSGSDLIFYHSSSGEFTADKIWNFAAKYGLGGGSGSVSSSYAITASYALNGGGTGITPGGSYDISASWASASLTASYALNAGPTISSSWASASISASYAETSSTTVFNGNRLIKRSPYTTVNVGTSTVTEFLEKFFFPFIPATLAIASSGTTYYETGSSQSFAINSTITANDEVSYGTGSVRRNGVVWQTVGSIPPLSFNYTDPFISASYSYISYAQTDNNGSPTVIASSTRAASFIFPYLYGVSTTAGLTGSALYSALTTLVQTSGNKTVSMVGSTVYMYFAYPSSYPVLTSILDKNLFEVISGFEYSASVPVTSSGLGNNWMAIYKVYRTKIVSDPSGNYQFKQ